MPMYLLGVDIGTSSAKSVIFDCDGNLITQASRAYVFEAAKSGYAEQDPDVWWTAVTESMKEAMETSFIDKKDLAGIGLSGQMHGMVCVDQNGKPVRKAILHCDVRAGEEADEIRMIAGDEFSQIVYNPIFPGMQAVSLYWVKQHEPECYNRIKTVVCPKDYIRYKMTGKLGTEHTDASGTLFYDQENFVWSERIFEILGIDMSLVPEDIHSSCDVAGGMTKEAAELCGVAPGTPVIYGGGDQAMHSLGNNVFRPGTTMATIGTSGQVLSIVERPVYNPNLNTHMFRHVEDNTWFGLGAVLSAGSALDWFRRNMDHESSFEELSRLAEGVACGSDGLVFLPCMTGERTPYLDPAARGVFFGLSMKHSKAHFARAIMEGVSFAMKSALNEVDNLFGKQEVLICAGGGVKSKAWAQIQADIYGRDIMASTVKEQACLGAAIAAGVGTKLFASVEEGCHRMCTNGTVIYHPNPECVNWYAGIYEGIYSKLYINNKELFSIASQYY